MKQVESTNDDLKFSSSKNPELTELRHRQIADGACRLFFEKGYHPTTIREIAEACNISLGQLYHYVSSKDDILYLVYKRMQEIWYEASKKLNKQNGDPLQMLISSLNLSTDFVVENKKLIQFLYAETKYLDKKHLSIVLRMDNQYVVRYWRSLLQELGKRKPIKTDMNFAASLLSYVLVFPALRSWNIKGRSAKKNAELLIDFILRGLGLTE